MTETVDERFAAYSKLVRPFPVRKLHDTLYQALTQAESIRNAADMLLMDPPVTVEDWTDRLYEIVNWLDTLTEVCEVTAPKVERLIEQAPGDHRRAMAALVAMVRGLQQEAAREAGDGPDVALAA